MKPTRLKRLLGEVDPSREALIGAGAGLSYEDVCKASWNGPSAARVAVGCRDLGAVARALVALDGAVAALCAIPPQLAGDDLRAVLEQGEFDHALVDDDDARRSAFEAGGAVCHSPDEALSKRGDGAAFDGATEWLVPTSGTTAAPKLVVHTLESLARAALAGRNPSAQPQVWGMLYDLTRFAGFQVFFQALLSGHTLVCDTPDASLGARLERFLAARVTHLSATPTLWRKILMAPERRDLTLKQITLGGEAADQPTLTALAKAFPEARITHIFASTEAGVGMAVSDGRAGFPLAYTQAEHGGVEVRIEDERLQVRAATSASGYAGDTPLGDADGWVDTGDLVRVEGDRFHIIGRESGVINVGGDKVVPDHVRAVLLECPVVREAVVYAKKSSFTGALVAADIVLHDPAMDAGEARAALKEHAASRLSATQVPRILRFVSDIEVSSAGKAKPQS
ncbi:MAG: fatty acid--CoA ligase family protein [Pseudomonadota bacterium]